MRTSLKCLTTPRALLAALIVTASAGLTGCSGWEVSTFTYSSLPADTTDAGSAYDRSWGLTPHQAESRFRLILYIAVYFNLVMAKRHVSLGSVLRTRSKSSIIFSGTDPFQAGVLKLLVALFKEGGRMLAPRPKSTYAMALNLL